jgi:hypothetical protein
MSAQDRPSHGWFSFVLFRLFFLIFIFQSHVRFVCQSRKEHNIYLFKNKSSILPGAPFMTQKKKIEVVLYAGKLLIHR